MPMKTIKVQITAFHGKGVVRGEKIGDCIAQILIGNEAAATLQNMLAALPAKMDSTHCIDRDDLRAVIAEGHTELEKVQALILDRGRELLTRHRIAQVNTANIDEALSNAFFQDIEDSVYAPVLSLDEFIEYLTDTADDGSGEELAEHIDDLYYNKYRNDYQQWVLGHLNDDCRFVADRIDVDTTDIYSGEADNRIFYAITEIE